MGVMMTQLCYLHTRDAILSKRHPHILLTLLPQYDNLLRSETTLNALAHPPYNHAMAAPMGCMFLEPPLWDEGLYSCFICTVSVRTGQMSYDLEANNRENPSSI